MPKKQTATLAAGLIATKGHAAPVGRPGAAEDYYKSLTVKLTRERFEAIKGLGMRENKTSQRILVEALDLWLARAAAPAEA
jgi:hypothetical protein